MGNLNESNINKIYLKASLIILGFSFSIILLFWGPSLIGGILALSILVILSWFISGMNLLHPLTWFPPLFFMYSVSMPMLILVGEFPFNSIYEYTLFVQWVALLTFIIFVGRNSDLKKTYDLTILRNIKYILIPIFSVSLILSSVYLIYIYTRGLTSKYAIALDQSIYSSFHGFFSILVFSYLILFTYKLIKDQKFPKIFFIFTITFALLILIIAGERDILLRMILGTIFIVHFFHRRIKKKLILTMGIIGVFAISILSNMKNLAFGERESVRNESLIVDIFGGEFRSASRNLYTLISGSDSWTYFNGETLIWDLKIAAFINSTSPGAWFNQNFYPELVASGGGNGFSLVAEGYLNFGILGVILWFAILGLILKYLYKKAHTGLIWALIYIILIPIVIYANRGDFATILTYFSKHIALPLILVFFIKHILEKDTFILKKPRSEFIKNIDYMKAKQ
ncbi:O-antigen polymerase [Alkalihalophilus lindianensis]|uniref:O-antigen polymerase n=1 Tax=Alkalihalophilus lindianensis TaxID=1630542 RepID=A0ABU3X9W0_9BACI|nr:O-antigen polymerase [Alkalihalophilus lindianensis]MDV2684407.1 O-antigen polymerase [Alkalihalophilus lindianensis]